MAKKVAFYTLGCKVNQYETNALSQMFIENGYKVVDNTEYADIYVINTCTVTSMADKKSRQTIRKSKEINPSAITVAVGCYVQMASKELKDLEGIDLVLGNSDKDKIIDYIEKHVKEQEITNIMEQNEYLEYGSTTYTERTRAVVKIQDGCDRFCSYCIIPYARGRVRSRNPQNILAEVAAVVKNGIKEIVLTGIHISSYGKDFNKNYVLIDLLEELNEVEGLERIRLGSLDPTIITEEFVVRLKGLIHVCNHFHLSLQSGCDETLKRMNRHYSTGEFKGITNLLRVNIPDVILTTDIIVGFPGETEKEFEETYEYLKEIKFYKMHVFKYSPRKGTRAADMKGQVSNDIKEKRSKKIIQLSNNNEEEIMEQYLGRKLEILFEQENKGHTTNYLSVKIDEDIQENTMRTVKITGLGENELIGELLKP